MSSQLINTHTDPHPDLTHTHTHRKAPIVAAEYTECAVSLHLNPSAAVFTLCDTSLRLSATFHCGWVYFLFSEPTEDPLRAFSSPLYCGAMQLRRPDDRNQQQKEKLLRLVVVC